MTHWYEACLECGHRFNEGEERSKHYRTDKHQRAVARITVYLADNRICPYCKHGKKVKKCRDQKHADRIAYCSALLEEKEAENP